MPSAIRLLSLLLLLGPVALAQGRPASHPVPAPSGGDDLGFEATWLGRTVDGRRAVRLRYPDGREAEASVGRNAIVRVAPGTVPGEAVLSRWKVHFLRPLMPSLGLVLVESAVDGEDGISLAKRLRALGDDGPAEAFPDLWVGHRAFAAPKPNDAMYAAQWFFSDLAMPDAWAISKGDPAVTVVVVDDGCDANHPDLVAKLDPGRDVVDRDDDPSPVPHTEVNYHGTACAGLVGASTDNDLGVAGACPNCRMRCVRLLGAGSEQVPFSADVDAFQFAFDSGAAVVSNSWGFTDALPVPKPLADAINHVAEAGRDGKGALVFFAAGNDDRRVNDDELLGVRGVIGVGAVTHYAEKTQYSNFGASVDLVAPTGAVTTDISGADGDNSGDYTTTFGGTSSACPIAAGIGALLVSVAPDATAEELTQAMLDTTRRAPDAEPDANGHDDFYGRGIIDPVKALKAVMPVQPVVDAGTPDPGSAGDAPGGCGCGQVELAWLAAVPVMLRRKRR